MPRLLIGSIALSILVVGSSSAALAADVGSPADVAAVRAAEHAAFPHDTIGGVHVSGDYALVQWYGNPEGSGPRAFRRVSGEHWKNIYSDGGVTSVGILAQHGIPASAARSLCSGWPAAEQLCQR